MRRSTVIVALVLGLIPRAAWAQDTGGFTVLHGTDTVAAEQFSREDVTLSGTLRRRSGKTPIDRVRYRAVLVNDQSAPLVELSAWRGEDPDNSPARQTARVIFKDDSAAVDDATPTGGLTGRILPTARAVVPYLNLSMAFLELATRRAAQTHGDSLAIPFFNLGGGQTVTGTVLRLGEDSVAVRLGTVEFRLRVDSVGRILGGRVPAQELTINRVAAS